MSEKLARILAFLLTVPCAFTWIMDEKDIRDVYRSHYEEIIR